MYAADVMDKHRESERLAAAAKYDKLAEEYRTANANWKKAMQTSECSAAASAQTGLATSAAATATAQAGPAATSNMAVLFAVTAQAAKLAQSASKGAAVEESPAKKARLSTAAAPALYVEVIRGVPAPPAPVDDDCYEVPAPVSAAVAPAPASAVVAPAPASAVVDDDCYEVPASAGARGESAGMPLWADMDAEYPEVNLFDF